MNSKITTSTSTTTELQKAYLDGEGKGQTDWGRLKREHAAGIEPDVDPDEGEFDWSLARVVMPPSKRAISIRVDSDVLDFFRSQGRGYQTRVNAVLRSYMEAKRGRGRKRVMQNRDYGRHPEAPGLPISMAEKRKNKTNQQPPISKEQK